MRFSTSWLLLGSCLITGTRERFWLYILLKEMASLLHMLSLIQSTLKSIERLSSIHFGSGAVPPNQLSVKSMAILALTSVGVELGFTSERLFLLSLIYIVGREGLMEGKQHAKEASRKLAVIDLKKQNVPKDSCYMHT